MKYRGRNSKIKYQHQMIRGLRGFLEKELSPLEYIEAIIPGEIKPKKGVSSGLKIKFRYQTKTGAKLMAYSPGAVQEIFVVTGDPEALKRSVEDKESYNNNNKRRP